MRPIRGCVLVVFGVITAVFLLAAGIFYLVVRNSSSGYEKLPTSAVVANGIECADIGMKILKQHGSVADSAIATLLCEGITCPQSMGIGGGFLLTIYTKQTGVVETINAREIAPLTSTENMFRNSTKVDGVLSIAVPGEIKGYWELHQKYGRLPWSSLFDPVIELCQRGHIISSYLARLLQISEASIRNSSTLREIYINNETNKILVEGNILKRLDLVETLRTIAREGANSLYSRNGSIVGKLVRDIQDAGGIITIEDFENYKVDWRKPEMIHLINNKTFFSTPSPGSGPIISFILNILNGYVTNQSLTSYQRIIETFKYAYALRTELGDPLFVPQAIEISKKITNLTYSSLIRSILQDNQTNQDARYYGAKFDLKDDHGTAHVGILGSNGDAISVTSSINYLFGSKFRSRSTGIILNNEMDDFGVPGKKNIYGLPPSPANLIVPGKRPLSSMCSTVLTDRDGNAELILGAAGGTKILSSIAYVIIRYLWFNEPLFDAINARRLHHQLVPMHIEYEDNFDENILNGLIKIGHKAIKAKVNIGFSSVTGIAQKGGKISAVYDPRRGGSSSVF